MHHAVAAGDVDDARSRPARRPRARRRGPARTARRSPTSRPCSRTSGGSAARERAAVLDDYGWELYNAHRFREAVDAGRARRRAVRRARRPGTRSACASCGCRGTCSWTGETDAAEACAAARRGDPRAGRRAPRSPTRALPRRDPRVDRRAASAAGAVLEQRRWLARRAGRPDLAALCAQLPRHRARRGRRRGGRRAARDEHRRRARRRPPRGRRARLHEPGRAAAADRAARRARALRRRRPRVRARARLLARTPTTSRSTAACCSLRRGDWDARRARAARARRRRRGRRGCSTPTACRGSGGCSRGAASPRAGALLAQAWEQATPHAPAAQPRLRRDRTRRVGVAGGRARRGGARSRTSARRALGHPGAAPFRGELLRYLRAGRSAARRRSRAARRRGPPACAATGAAPPPGGATRRPLRARRSSSLESGEPEPTAAGAARSLDAARARDRPPPSPASACGRWARRSRAARARRRGQPAGLTHRQLAVLAPAARGDDQRGDRGAPGPLRADGRPPRGRRPRASSACARGARRPTWPSGSGSADVDAYERVPVDAAPAAVVEALREALRSHSITVYAVVDHGHGGGRPGARRLDARLRQPRRWRDSSTASSRRRSTSRCGWP